MTHKSPFNALSGIPNFRRSLTLARRSLDHSPKAALDGEKWDKAVVSTPPSERQL